MDTEIDYVPYDPSDPESELKTFQLIEAFRDIFAAPPWGEWLKCSDCGVFFSKKDYSYLLNTNFTHLECGKKLVDFWPRDEVYLDLQKQITPETSAFLAMDGRKVVGFTWGYPMRLKEMLIELGLPDLSLGINPDEVIFYQDEVGVLEQYRGKKIAKKLVYHRARHFIENNPAVSFCFVRTRKSPEPSITYLWYVEKLGYSIAAEYEDGRVVLQKSLRESNFLHQLI